MQPTEGEAALSYFFHNDCGSVTWMVMMQIKERVKAESFAAQTPKDKINRLSGHTDFTVDSVLSKNKMKRKQLRQQLWELQEGKCYWCDHSVTLPDEETGHVGYSSGLMATFDHVIPRCKGGSNDPKNIVIACHICNNLRGDMGIQATVEWLREARRQNAFLGCFKIIPINGMFSLIGRTTRVLGKICSTFKSARRELLKFEPEVQEELCILHLATGCKIQKNDKLFNSRNAVQSLIDLAEYYDHHKVVERLAYELWEQAGRPVSDGKDFWYKAESLLHVN